ncbi:class I SAM-dependent methyltransferase [Nannocystis pusilla]|uniref:class I SAM-dependent methyltransferase n=1 Tax=Nannocystis pusilla TaxID=889268 RepID=UPI003B7F946F
MVQGPERPARRRRRARGPAPARARRRGPARARRDPRARHAHARRRPTRPEDRHVPRPAREPAPHPPGRARRETLNLFSYTGGFSLAAALGGAPRVTSVDLARNAVDAARDNFALNDLDPAAHGFVAADAFAFLEDTAGTTYDLVIVDPPSFAPNHKAVRAAEAAYARLNASALRQVRPGGLLAAASCSSHVPMDMFLYLSESARQARRPLRLLEVRHEPPDHPSPLHFPEGRYLKFVLALAE